jgi:hypothetical protein
MPSFITKSNFMSGLQCPKRLWFEKSNVANLSETQQRIIEQGQEVGVFARQYFSDGILIQGRTMEALQATQQVMQTGASCLFEAAFLAEHLLIRCDVLRRVGDEWELIEVKSSSQVKPEYLWDVAFQKYVLQNAGVAIAKTQLMHINTQDCFYPDLSNFFRLQDITAEVDQLISEIPDKIRVLVALSEEPVIAIGRHCSMPYACPFKVTCWQEIPENSVLTIPRLSWETKEELFADGIVDMSEIPSSLSLSYEQNLYVRSVIEDQPIVDWDAIAASLSTLTYPIHFFDFETLNPAIPRFKGLKPYEQFPFQYSCHILHADGSEEHREFLHTDSTDPRPELIQALIEDIAATGSVMVYHQSFEERILRKLMRDFPKFEHKIDAIVTRLWDLELIFKRFYFHPDFQGSTSLKKVLPVIIPTLNYEALTISKGDHAQIVWEAMILERDPYEKQALINHLLDYCQLDTLAMLKLYQELTLSKLCLQSVDTRLSLQQQ